MSNSSMGDSPSGPPAPAEDAGGMSNLRGLVIACYVLFLIAAVNGLTAIVSVIIAYVKRRDAAGTIWESHFSNLILVFWIMLFGVLLCWLTWPIALGAMFASWPYFWPSAITLPLVFGFIIFPVLAIWYLYRVIRGLIRASEQRAY